MLHKKQKKRKSYIKNNVQHHVEHHVEHRVEHHVEHCVEHHVEHCVELIYQYNIMRMPNYDAEEDTVSNFKQLYDFMPNKCFRMLICGPSGSGKTNTLNNYMISCLINVFGC